MTDETKNENAAGTDAGGEAGAATENNENAAAVENENADGAAEQEQDDKGGEDNADNNSDNNSDDGGEEIYYSQIEMPEGFEVNQELMAEVAPILKEMGASKENAGKIAAIGAKLVQDTLNKQQAAWQKQVDDWEKEVLADPEIGSKEAIAIANRAVQKFASPKLQDELLRLGIGNHPELVRCFHKIGTMISDDALVVSSKSSAENKTLGEVLYGDKYEKKSKE